MIRTVVVLLLLAAIVGCEPKAVPMSGGQSAGTTYTTETEHRIGPPTKLTVSDQG